jgi:hypothetical protein
MSSCILKGDKMGAGKNQLRFPLIAVNGIVTETLDYATELQKH